VLLDHRVRRGGSHHQKLFVVQHADPARDVAFVGGIDLCHGRRDDSHHLGDAQVVALDDEHYGPRPPWHDVQIELHGPAVDDLAWTFRERWCDTNPLDARNPLRSVLHRFSHQPSTPSAPAPSRPAPPDGPLAVQVLRTYPARRRAYPFAPEGERSIARAYLKAFARARRLVYLEDQYLWSLAATEALRAALVRHPDLHVVMVIPRYPDPDGAVAGEASRIGRERVLDALHEVGHERVAVYDLENRAGTPVYVHSKVCVVDDVWMAVGSDNLNRRSWTHDSELSCAVVDARHDERAPADPGGLGDGARVLARDTRIRLAAEHLGRAPEDVDDLVDPADWFAALQRSAARLDEWHRAGAVGERPAGHLREHPIERVRGARRWGRGFAHAVLLDPDGRPRALRRRGAF
jgi:phosphatidylserine/phosphatidylglycerophosphate/cardiolipin synthase-like enzyme